MMLDKNQHALENHVHLGMKYDGLDSIEGSEVAPFPQKYDDSGSKEFSLSLSNWYRGFSSLIS